MGEKYSRIVRFPDSGPDFSAFNGVGAIPFHLVDASDHLLFTRNEHIPTCQPVTRRAGPINPTSTERTRLED